VTPVVQAPPGAGGVHRRLLLAAGLMPSLACAALAVYPPSFVTRLDLDVYDALIRVAGTRPPSGQVVVVDIDEHSVSTIGQWPWRRDVIGRLVSRVREMDARVIALDIIFAEADRQQPARETAPASDASAAPAPDAELAGVLNGGGVIMGYAFTFGDVVNDPRPCVLHPLRLTTVQPGGDAPGAPYFDAAGALCSLPALAEAAGASGFLNASPDGDGILRRVPLVLEMQGRVYPALALAVAMSASQADHAVLRVANANTTSLGFANRAVPLDGRSNLLIRYRGKRRSFPHISAGDVLSGRLPADTFRGKVVFVGATALGTQEIVATPLDAMLDGVEMQATVADNLLSGDFVRRPEHAAVLQAAIALALGLGLAFVVRALGVIPGGLAAVAVLAILWAGGVWLIQAFGIFLSPMVPSAALVLSSTAAALAVRAEERRSTFADLQSARRATEAASIAKSEFLMNVSHELRTPLNAMYGYAQILAKGVLRDDQKSRALETIERNARAQTQLIDDLLDASRTAAGKLTLKVTDVDLAVVVRAVAHVVRPATDAKHLDLHLSIDDEVGVVAGDLDRLQQVVWRIVSNAIKFTPEKGHVAILLERTKSSALLTVTDSGFGIEPEFLPHVFEPFRQQDGSTTRQHGGLGLGLALVREIVELHGGTIEAESPGVGGGATFRVRLPLKSAEQSPLTDISHAGGDSRSRIVANN
jgi:signal transduction histidine kinase